MASRHADSTAFRVVAALATGFIAGLVVGVLFSPAYYL